MCFNPSENVVFVPAKTPAMWHLERTRNQVLVFLARGEGPDGGSALANQCGELLDEKDADGWRAAGLQASVCFRQMRNRHVHP